MASKYSRQPGDSILALLEPGEYVLNRNAVNEIGKENLDELNFEDSPRFNMAQRSEMQLGGMLGDYIGMQTGGSMEYGGANTDLPTFPYLYEKMDIQPVWTQKHKFEKANAYDPSSEGVHFEDYSRAVTDSTKTGQQKLLSQGQELQTQLAKSGFAGAGGPQAIADTSRGTIMDDFISQQAAAQSSLFKGVKSERDDWLKTTGQNLLQLQQAEGTEDYNLNVGGPTSTVGTGLSGSTMDDLPDFDTVTTLPTSDQGMVYMNGDFYIWSEEEGGYVPRG